MPFQCFSPSVGTEFLKSIHACWKVKKFGLRAVLIRRSYKEEGFISTSSVGPAIHYLVLKDNFLKLNLRIGQAKNVEIAGKSLSEVLIYLSINPQYDNRLFNDLPVQYEKIPRPEHFKNMSRTCCLHKLFRCCKFKV